MAVFLSSILILTTLAGLGLGFYWLIVVFRILQTKCLLPTARAGLSMAVPEGTVCVVIPAHNEERAIGNLIHSLRQQDHPRVRFVLALDRCTDQTVQIARDAVGADDRFEIMEITECPEDWAGKVNAVWTAVTHSVHAREADMILFSDADTTFHPGCVRATAALLRGRKLDLLSLMSTLTSDRWYEKLIQPAAAFELMQQFPPLHASRAKRRRAFANGQFMLFDAKAYWSFGGHEAVKDHLLEDMGLARVVAKEHLAAGLLLADGLLICRMYASWAAFCKGWKRIYTECAKRKPRRLLRAACRMRVVYTILPILTVAGLLGSLLMEHAAVAPVLISLTTWTCAIALTLWAIGLVLIYQMNASPLWSILLHPFGAWQVASILQQAADDLIHDRPTQWGGKSYNRQIREG